MSATSNASTRVNCPVCDGATLPVGTLTSKFSNRDFALLRCVVCSYAFLQLEIDVPAVSEAQAGAPANQHHGHRSSHQSASHRSSGPAIEQAQCRGQYAEKCLSV